MINVDILSLQGRAGGDGRGSAEFQGAPVWNGVSLLLSWVVAGKEGAVLGSDTTDSHFSY